MEFLLLTIALITAGVLLRHNRRIQEARDALAARQTYEHIACPILVCSDCPDDDSVNKRAQEWREKLRASGNKYAEVLPIVAYPYALGASPETGGLRTWNTYRENCLLKEQAIRDEWFRRMATENNALFSAHILNQQSVN